MINYTLGMISYAKYYIQIHYQVHSIELAKSAKAAGKYFDMAYDMICKIKDTPLPKKQLAEVKAFLDLNRCLNKSEAYYNIANYHCLLAPREVLRSHMSLAVAYLKKVLHLQVEKTNASNLSKEQKSQI